MSDEQKINLADDPEALPAGHRYLKDGESIDGLRILGVPCRISGTGVRVTKWKDGSETATIPPQAAKVLRRMEALRLILGSIDVFSGLQIRLIRRELKLTQADLAELLGISRVTLNQLEVSGSLSDRTKTLAIKYIARRSLSTLLSAVDDHTRELNRPFFEALQVALNDNDFEEMAAEGELHTDNVNLCHSA